MRLSCQDEKIPWSKWRILVLLLITCFESFALTSIRTVHSGGLSSISGFDVETMLREAMELSNASTKNITAAHRSCQIWSQLLNDNDSLGFQGSYPPNVVVLSLALYGSCLVRTGKDTEAVNVYEKALNIDPSQQDLRLSKAQALQRLLRYADAGKSFQQLSSDVGLVGAGTCALRLGDLSSAQRVLAAIISSSIEDSSPALQGMMGAIRYMESGAVDESCKDLLRSAARGDLLYHWIYAVLAAQGGYVIDKDFKHPGDPLFSLLKLNLCPFDDPSLLLLDDKVHLHRILSKYGNRTDSFWPSGMVLSPASTAFEVNTIVSQRPAHSLYFVKERSGYGSHGNRIFSGTQVNAGFQDIMLSNDGSEKLLQTMVHPPLLLHGRKFSLRIYVIFFSTSEVYLSSSGLVKLASSAILSDDSLDPRVHVTNSGSGLDMEQYDLDYLRSYLQSLEIPFDIFWGKLECAIKVVVDSYNYERRIVEWESCRESLGIPKILGFDFVVDQYVQPWLVEVNRFPGLEPRDESDRAVKTQVVHDAWACASQRLSIAPFNTVLKSLHVQGSTSSLRRLPK